MAFHRFTTPAYAGGLRSGDDYINNAVTGTPAPMGGPIAAGTYLNSYFLGMTEGITAATINRGFKALAVNTDYLDDQVTAAVTAINGAVASAATNATNLTNEITNRQNADTTVANNAASALAAVSNALAASTGEGLIGGAAVAGASYALTAGTLANQLAQLLGFDNTIGARATAVEGRATALETSTTYLTNAIDHAHCGLRLTLSSTDPTGGAADVIGGTTLYFRGFTDQIIWLYDATNGFMPRPGSASLVLSGMTAGLNYDVFAYWDGAATQLELGTPWANDTTPNAFTIFGGVRYKGATGTLRTRRYVGTIRATAAGLTDDQATNRLVFNAYNKIWRTALVADASAASWSYTGTAFRQVHALGTNKVQLLFAEPTPIQAYSLAAATMAANSQRPIPGIGLDSTTVNMTGMLNFSNISSSNFASEIIISRSELDTVVAAGFHIFNWLESSSTGATATGFYGSQGTLNPHMRIRALM